MMKYPFYAAPKMGLHEDPAITQQHRRLMRRGLTIHRPMKPGKGLSREQMKALPKGFTPIH